VAIAPFTDIAKLKLLGKEPEDISKFCLDLQKALLSELDYIRSRITVVDTAAAAEVETVEYRAGKAKVTAGTNQITYAAGAMPSINYMLFVVGFDGSGVLTHIAETGMVPALDGCTVHTTFDGTVYYFAIASK